MTDSYISLPVYDQNSVVAKLVALLFRVWDAPSSDLSLETGNADKLFVPPSVPSGKYECFTSSYVTTAFFPVLFSSLFINHHTNYSQPVVSH